MKKCFKCKRKLPLFMYKVDHSKYQIASNFGRVITCRFCTFKQMKRDKGIMQRIDGKFMFVPMTKKELIKYILKK